MSEGRVAALRFGGPAAAPPEVAEATKDASRLAALDEPRPALPAPRLAAPAKPTVAAASWRMLDPRPAGAPARFAAAEPLSTGSLVPGPFRAAAADAAGGWREEEFAQVRALDGRTLATPTLLVRLSGLELPPDEEICRTLDGRLESCAVRAATQLELITRARKVSCRYRVEGACRVGGGDLAERLMRAGFAKRSGGGIRVAAAPAAAAN